MSSAPDDQRAALLKLLVPEAAPLFAEQYGELREWAHGSLDAYRAELVRALYPFFCRCYVGLVQCGGRAADGGAAEARARAAQFAQDFGEEHAAAHREELNLLLQVSAPEQLDGSPFVARLRAQRSEVALGAYAQALLVHFLQSRRLGLLLAILNDSIRVVDGGGASGDASGGAGGGAWLPLAAGERAAAYVARVNGS